MKVSLFAVLFIALGLGLYMGIVKLIALQNEAQTTSVVPNLGELGGRLFPDSLSIPAYRERTYDGRDFMIGKKLAENSAYTRYHITYKSGMLTISGIMNMPKGKPPIGGFPVLFLNHGYIDPAAYTNGRGLVREQDYFARRGYAVVHSDYRNYAQSDKDAEVDVQLRFGYVEDVINAVIAVKKAELPYLNTAKIGMLGHSMGGGVTQKIMVIKPDLVQAVALFAPVSVDQWENYTRWTTGRPIPLDRIRNLYGSPDENPEFWNNVSPAHFISDISVPVILHHGTNDMTVPIEWSDKLAQLMKDGGKSVDYYRYPGEKHEFINAWPLVMRRTVSFFDRLLKPEP